LLDRKDEVKSLKNHEHQREPSAEAKKNFFAQSGFLKYQNRNKIDCETLTKEIVSRSRDGVVHAK
jgi:hypothetical protein